MLQETILNLSPDVYLRMQEDDLTIGDTLVDTSGNINLPTLMGTQDKIFSNVRGAIFGDDTSSCVELMDNGTFSSNIQYASPIYISNTLCVSFFLSTTLNSNPSNISSIFKFSNGMGLEFNHSTKSLRWKSDDGSFYEFTFSLIEIGVWNLVSVDIDLNSKIIILHINEDTSPLHNFSLVGTETNSDFSIESIGENSNIKIDEFSVYNYFISSLERTSIIKESLRSIVRGITREKGVPTPLTYAIYNKDDFSLFKTSISNSSGKFSVDTYGITSAFLVLFDDEVGESFNASVVDKILPIPTIGLGSTDLVDSIFCPIENLQEYSIPILFDLDNSKFIRFKSTTLEDSEMSYVITTNYDINTRVTELNEDEIYGSNVGKTLSSGTTNQLKFLTPGVSREIIIEIEVLRETVEESDRLDFKLDYVHLFEYLVSTSNSSSSILFIPEISLYSGSLVNSSSNLTIDSYKESFNESNISSQINLLLTSSKDISAESTILSNSILVGVSESSINGVVDINSINTMIIDMYKESFNESLVSSSTSFVISATSTQ